MAVFSLHLQLTPIQLLHFILCFIALILVYTTSCASVYYHQFTLHHVHHYTVISLHYITLHYVFCYSFIVCFYKPIIFFYARIINPILNKNVRTKNSDVNFIFLCAVRLCFYLTMFSNIIFPLPSSLLI